MLKIYFCFPYRGLGGVSLLFLRVAESLAQKKNTECHLVDYIDGFMARNINSSNVILEIYEDDGKLVEIPSDAIAVFQSMTPWSIFPGIKLSSETRMFFWNCYPFNLIPFFPGLRRWMQDSKTFAHLILLTILRGYWRKMRNFVLLLHDKNSIVFMDVPNVKTTEQYLSLSIVAPAYLPIPLEGLNNISINSYRDFKECGLHVVWVGRIVDFKFFTLKRFLIELSKLQPILDLKITFTIIGSGNYSQRLKKQAKNLSNINYKFIEYIAPNHLENFLINNADILVAMGTSAIEGARLGIPTILLDIAHSPVSTDYVFKWLHDCSGYSLGNFVQKKDLIESNNSLEDCINQLINCFPVLSAKAFEYFQRNHEMNVVANNLLVKLHSATCTYKDLLVAGFLVKDNFYLLFKSLRRLVTHR